MSNFNGWEPDDVAPHVCRTSDGQPISVGMWVIDYDRRLSRVTEVPREMPGGREFSDTVCWSCAGHHGHWWDTSTGIFDGSRMTTRGVAEAKKLAEPQYTPLSRGFSCQICQHGYAHNEVSHDNGDTWIRVCDDCYPIEMAK